MPSISRPWVEDLDALGAIDGDELHVEVALERVEHSVEGVFAAQPAELGVGDLALFEIDDAGAFALELDGAGLAAHLEGLHQIDHAHVRQAAAEPGLRLALLDPFLLDLLKNHLHAGDDLFDVDRLGQVVVAAQLEAAHLELDRLLAGEKDERNVAKAFVAFEHPGQLEAVHLGHSGFRQHQVGRRDLHLVERVFAVNGRGHLKASLLQADFGNSQVLCVAIDEEEMLLCHGARMFRHMRLSVNVWSHCLDSSWCYRF